jgi:2-amino-4-hydroxy-6-hydroxymethyldihydropteridine diphosphokinase
VGSNLDDPVAQVGHALSELDELPRTHCAARSSLYRSAPMGPQDQPPYVNAVAALDTALGPDELLERLQEIERRHGRVRGAQRWGPRTLDLDILLYGDAVLSTERLTVPHPGLCERSFVLVPLLEIAPQLEVPGQGSVASLAEACAMAVPERLEAAP